MREHDFAALGEVLAELEQAAVLSGEQPGQRSLAVEQGGAPQVCAIEMEEVEQVVAEPVAAAFAQVGLQGAEVRRAPLRLHHDLAIQQGGGDRGAPRAPSSRDGNFVVQSSPLRVLSVTRP